MPSVWSRVFLLPAVASKARFLERAGELMHDDLTVLSCRLVAGFAGSLHWFGNRPLRSGDRQPFVICEVHQDSLVVSRREVRGDHDLVGTGRVQQTFKHSGVHVELDGMLINSFFMSIDNIFDNQQSVTTTMLAVGRRGGTGGGGGGGRAGWGGVTSPPSSSCSSQRSAPLFASPPSRPDATPGRGYHLHSGRPRAVRSRQRSCESA